MSDMVTATFAAFVREEIATANTALVGMLREQDADRQEIEDVRSIRRNRNRMWTLLVALLLGFIVTYTLSHDVFGPWASHTFGPYSFVITVLLDSGLALYAYIRRY